MSTPFEVQCSKCEERFECSPGKLNSTKYLGETSKNLYLPKCPHCGNWRDNQLITPISGTLSEPLRY